MADVINELNAAFEAVRLGKLKRQQEEEAVEAAWKDIQERLALLPPWLEPSVLERFAQKHGLRLTDE
jgi:hypothetical protein